MDKRQGERVPNPIANDLRVAFSQERIDRLWREIGAARAGGAARGPRMARPLVFALAAACSIVAGLVLVLELSKGAPVTPAPLVRADGAALDVIAPRNHEASVALSDGSQLFVAEGSVLAPLDVSDRSVVLHLVRGRSRFVVKPGGPRRWVIEVGHASVEVVGTRFGVERDAEGVTVEVEEGKVLVRSAVLPDGVVRLSAGGRVRVPSRPPIMEETTKLVAPIVPAPAQRAKAPEPKPVAASKAAAPRPAPAKARQPSDTDELFAIADDARMARDYRGAIEALERVIREHGGDPRAKLAAFTIGRIHDEQFRDLARATLAYENALALGLSGSLAEDCYFRLLRVLDVQVAEARVPRERLVQTAQQYLQRYPKGKYGAEAVRFVEGKSAQH